MVAAIPASVSAGEPGRGYGVGALSLEGVLGRR